MSRYWLVAVGLALAACGHPAEKRELTPVPAVKVIVVKAASETWPVLYEATGTVTAQTSAVIAAKVMGYVREVKVQVGDRFREGQLLVAIDTRELDVAMKRAEAAQDAIRFSIPMTDSGVAVAKANVDLARTTFARMKELFDKKSVSSQEFDEAAARLKSTEASFEMAKARRTQLNAEISQADQEVRAAEVTRTYAEIHAPFAGVVVAKLAEPGSLAMPGAPLLNVESEGGFRLEAVVEESRMKEIRKGQAVTVQLQGDPIEARVSEIVPAVDAASRSYTVRIALPAVKDIRSGVFGRARFAMGSRMLVSVPLDAVRERGQLQSVMVAEMGTARIRLVTIGQKAGDRVEVLSGLNAGELVIVPVPLGLSDGERIEVRQ